jgi:hypothetical protein
MVFITQALGCKELQLSGFACLVTLLGYIAITVEDRILSLKDAQTMGLIEHRIISRSYLKLNLLISYAQTTFLCLSFSLQLTAAGGINRWKFDAL